MAICMNALCGAAATELKQGWPLRSGGFAILCHNCWTLYEQLAFCDIFHSDDTGWRECISCGKRLHCGCIASSSLLEILDSSGVICIRCAKSAGVQPTGAECPTKFGTSVEKYVGEAHTSSIDNQINGDSIHNIKFKQFSNFADDNGPKQFLPPQNNDTAGSRYHMIQEGSMPPSADTRNTCLSIFSRLSAGSGSSPDAKRKIDKDNLEVKDVYGSPVQTNLTISLAAQSQIPHSLPTVASKPVLTAGLDPNASTLSQVRVARPPVEGRVKNQLLPRYWPRITEQELQQISGEYPQSSLVVNFF